MVRSNERRLTTPAGQRSDSFDSLKQAIANQYDGLSRRLQEVGEYALANPDDMALETIAVIASRAGVPPSSLIRFAKALGFEGFTEMQRLFRRRLVARSPTYGERIKQLQDREIDDDIASSVLDRFSTASIEGLERLQKDLQDDRLREAVDLLSHASTIYVIGQRRAFPIATYLFYLFQELGCRSSLLDGAGGMLEQQGRSIGEGDVLMAVSFHPYAADVVALAKACADRDLAVLALTDGPLSPLARLAKVTLEVVEGEVQGFRPLSASTCLALSLAVALGQRLAAIDNVDLE